MFRQSPFRWLVLAGIMLFLSGMLLEYLSGVKGNAHLVLGIPARHFTVFRNQDQGDPIQKELAVSLQVDSIQLNDFVSSYELQVRQFDEETSPSIHSALPPSSHLLSTFPLVPMEICKIGDTEFRFRLKQFYPDFIFQYSYPENRDTILPRAPGITINLQTPGKEEVVTLRSDQPKLQKLDDVVGLGYTIEFFWEIPDDILHVQKADTGLMERRIVFAGKEKKVFIRRNSNWDSMSMESNRFYSLPGSDSIGFTILQNFPDARWLKAVPGSKSEQLNNPVAEVEVWKMGGGAQSVFLYPARGSRPGGEWKVPGSNLQLTCNLSNKVITDACQCKMIIQDSVHGNNTYRWLHGSQQIQINGLRFRLTECDPSGIWSNFQVTSSPGFHFQWTGCIIGMASILGIWFQGLRQVRKKTERNTKEGRSI